MLWTSDKLIYCNVGPIHGGVDDGDTMKSQLEANMKIMLCYVPCYCSLELTLRCMRVGGRVGWQLQHSYTAGPKISQNVNYTHREGRWRGRRRDTEARSAGVPRRGRV